jgi:hypothetical protein
MSHSDIYVLASILINISEQGTLRVDYQKHGDIILLFAGLKVPKFTRYWKRIIKKGSDSIGVSNHYQHQDE